MLNKQINCLNLIFSILKNCAIFNLIKILYYIFVKKIFSFNNKLSLLIFIIFFRILRNDSFDC